jgi:hypothetical protein
MAGLQTLWSSALRRTDHVNASRSYFMNSDKHFSGKPGMGIERLSNAELSQVQGGAVRVLVDGRTPGTVDEFSLNMEIFKGNIGGPYLL